MDFMTRDELIKALRQMADPNWLGSRSDRMSIAATAAEALDVLGKSHDSADAKLAILVEKVDALSERFRTNN